MADGTRDTEAADRASTGSAFLSGNTGMGALLRAHDWSTSPLGSPGTWPLCLRATVSLMLGSRFPMFVAFGPDLGFVYNDAYAEILGAKHPAALGRRFRDIWSEIWADIAPLVDTALAGEATWAENMPLVLNRRGCDERAWFTFSYSPVRDEHDEVLGMFCTCTETTGQVQAETGLREAEARLEPSRTTCREDTSTSSPCLGTAPADASSTCRKGSSA